MYTFQTPQPTRKTRVSPPMKLYFFAIFTLLFVGLGFLASTSWFVALIAYIGCLPFWFCWICGYAVCRSSSGPRFPFSEARPLRPRIMPPQGPPPGEMERVARNFEAVLDQSSNSSPDYDSDDPLYGLSCVKGDSSKGSSEASAQEKAVLDVSYREDLGAEILDSNFHNSETLKLPNRSAKPSGESGEIESCVHERKEGESSRLDETLDNSNGKPKVSSTDLGFTSSESTEFPNCSTRCNDDSIEKSPQDLRPVLNGSSNSSCENGKSEVPSTDLGFTSSESTEFPKCSTKCNDDSIEKSTQDLKAVLNGSSNSSCENRVAPLNDIIVTNSSSLEIPESVEQQDSQRSKTIDRFGDQTFNNCESSPQKHPVVDEDRMSLGDCMKECEIVKNEYSIDKVPLELLYMFG